MEYAKLEVRSRARREHALAPRRGSAPPSSRILLPRHSQIRQQRRFFALELRVLIGQRGLSLAVRHPKLRPLPIGFDMHTPRWGEGAAKWRAMRRVRAETRGAPRDARLLIDAMHREYPKLDQMQVETLVWAYLKKNI